MASHLDLSQLSGCKKRKRGERVFRFRSFGENEYPVGLVGSSFRETVKALLEYGQVEGNLAGHGMHCWSFQLQVHSHAPTHVVLLVVEEPIEASLNRHCKECQDVGWGQHMVCNKKYHFVLPSSDTMVAACWNGKGGNASDGGLLLPNPTTTNNPNERKSSNNLVELEGHMMHGVFHSNGFGHLLCVNGVETGFDLAGRQILDFWDRLCTGLHARKVSLNDNSHKRGMELRLIHGVTYSEPWFGRWDYKFDRGTFCVTQQMYQKAIEALQGMPLCLLINHLVTSNHEIPLIFSRYSTLSDNSLVTIGDLFHFMLELKSRLPPTNHQNPCIDSIYNTGVLAETNCRWSPKRFRWVSRQEVRDAARAYIGDIGLLDFVLKLLGNHIVGNYLVCRTLNLATKVLEYCLEDISNHASPNHRDGLLMHSPKAKAAWYKLSKFRLMKDMFYMYKYVLKDQKMSNAGIFSAIPMAVRIILNSKYLVKDYCSEVVPMKVEYLSMDGESNIYCTISLKNNSEEDDDDNSKSIRNNNNAIILQPYECVTLKNNATFDDLKQEVERNFKEIYWGLRGFVVDSIANLNNAKGKDLVFGMVEVGQKIVLEGRSSKRMGGVSEIYECGAAYYVVDCPCGAKEDDGERMVSCDICEVRQHTLCVRIPDSEQVPHIFLCNRCEREIILLPSP
ncbi:PHD finger protein MALE STERILITY 1-like [Pyrus ussuriensis x Pyrus communis]|uniref:PHD finger protein MALE STERILITY 1-like n=1 Tax=Pyrus ussuriensis x Pyrus communis TaxID=2448454 RepID=A0A5N5G8Y0_9ROSA|nr:PHD finger protein MALE STERILITY 1-like [Pyrus ussuriensis x Pyrus communis]